MAVKPGRNQRNPREVIDRVLFLLTKYCTVVEQMELIIQLILEEVGNRFPMKIVLRLHQMKNYYSQLPQMEGFFRSKKQKNPGLI
jgi:hypothetical protein